MNATEETEHVCRYQANRNFLVAERITHTEGSSERKNGY